MKSHQPTTRVIAQLTGFSTATVSRALAGESSVKKATKEYILRKASELGYAPNGAARALAKASRLLELCVHPQLSFIATNYLEALKLNLPKQFVLSHPCLNVRITNSDQIFFGRFDCSANFMTEHTCVVAGGYIELDNRSAAFALVSYLRRLDHHHILCLAKNGQDAVMKERVAGFRAASLTYCDTEVVSDELAALSAYRTVRRLLRENNPFTAVLCLTPVFLEGVMSALEDEGKKVPDDISVVSFAELNGEGSHVTSIRPDEAGFAKTLFTAWQEKDYARPIPSVLVESGTAARRRAKQD
jgi:DNA-binding LacI/PurR family transcriptional regulator